MAEENRLGQLFEYLSPALIEIFAMYRIDQAASEGFYIEAIVRLDAVIDYSMHELLELSCDKEEKAMLVIFTQTFGKDGQLKQTHRILEKKGVINKNLADRIEKFRDTRNTLAHDVFGSIELLRKKYGNLKDSKELVKKEKDVLAEEYNKGNSILKELVGMKMKKKIPIQ